MAIKIILLACLLAVAHQVSSQNPDFKEECEKELNYKGDLSKIGEKATQEDKCYIACLMNKSGELKKDLTIDIEKAKEGIQKCKKSSPELKEKMIKNVDKCVKEVTAGADACETAYKHFICRTKET